ncbi:MAG: AmiS/UreI transporter [Gammaproteobacteria bacterium]|nr:AmiS/UreI transporter [Gammaproteobacteria bacterium]
MLGLILLYVGAVLFVNGVGGLGLAERRSVAVLNFLVGALALVVQLISLVRAQTSADYYLVATGFLFTFTYLYAAICGWFDLDLRAFGWFCLFVAVTTLPCAWLAFQGPDLRFGYMWAIWGLLWLMFYLAYVPGTKFGRVLPFATIGVGVFTCWIPGLMMLVGHW